MVTLDKRTGMVDWRIDDIGSPIVALYRLDGDGIISTPMTSVSQETLSKLISHFEEKDPNMQPKKPKKVNKIFSTLSVEDQIMRSHHNFMKLTVCPLSICSYILMMI